jgi:hypothetical protein
VHRSNASLLRDELGNVVVGTGASARTYGYEALDVVCAGDDSAVHFGGLFVTSPSPSNRSRLSLMDGTASGDYWFALAAFENLALVDPNMDDGLAGPVCAAGTLPISPAATKYIVTDVVELYATMDNFVDPAPKPPDFVWESNKYW